jgi:hypothetical protein
MGSRHRSIRFSVPEFQPPTDHSPEDCQIHPFLTVPLATEFWLRWWLRRVQSLPGTWVVGRSPSIADIALFAGAALTRDIWIDRRQYRDLRRHLPVGQASRIDVLAISLAISCSVIGLVRDRQAESPFCA